METRELESKSSVVRVNSNRSSNTTSPLSMISSCSTSDGVVLETENYDYDSAEVSTESEQSDGDAGEGGVDGLVLMGSTRLRPAPPQSSMDAVSRQTLYTQTFR